jgi:hypothetical protein
MECVPSVKVALVDYASGALKGTNRMPKPISKEAVGIIGWDPLERLSFTS